MNEPSGRGSQRRRHGVTRLAWLAWLALACAGCERSANASATETGIDAAAQVSEVVPSAASAPSTVAPSDPTRLLAASGSAYGATLAVTDDASFLLTGSAAYRFVQGEAPARWAGDFGVAPALAPGHILFWSDGAFRRVPTSGGEATLVARVPRQPRSFVTSGDEIAWLEQAADGPFTIHTLDGSQPRVVYAAQGYVGPLAMQDERIYFAERAPDRSWRLGLVPRSGGAAHFTQAKRGRLPAMLVLAESLYYYDGPSSSVLRVSPDLGNEELLATEVICSPIAVAQHVYCAQPAGFLEISGEGGVRRAFPLETRGSITSLAATATHLTWVTDIGGHEFAVDSIPLVSADSSPER